MVFGVLHLHYSAVPVGITFLFGIEGFQWSGSTLIKCPLGIREQRCFCFKTWSRDFFGATVDFPTKKEQKDETRNV